MWSQKIATKGALYFQFLGIPSMRAIARSSSMPKMLSVRAKNCMSCWKLLRVFSLCRPIMKGYIERLTELHLMKLEDVFKFSRLVFGYKLLNGHLPDSFSSLVQHSRLNSSRLLHLAAKTSSFFNSMFVTLPRLWNEIPSDIQGSKNLVAFKSGYRSFILNSYT